MLGTVILVAAALITWELGFKAAGVRPVSPWTLARWRREGRGFTLVDVRTPAEWDWARLPGSLSEPGLFPPPDRLPEGLKGLPRDEPLVLVCMSGHRSSVAGRWLRRQGYRDVYSLTGGVLGWMGSGHEVEKGEGGAASKVGAGLDAFWILALAGVALLAAGLWRHSSLLVVLAWVGLAGVMFGFRRREGSAAAKALTAALAWLHEPMSARKVVELVIGLVLSVLFIWAFWTHRPFMGVVAIIAVAAFKILVYRRIASG